MLDVVKWARKEEMMFSAREKPLDQGVLKRLNEAAEDHASSVIDLVASKLLASSSLQTSQIETLSRLWHEQLLSLKARNEPESDPSASTQAPPGRLIPPHPRLLEPVRPSPSVHGCVGRPAAFLKPPQYAVQQKKTDRKWKEEEDTSASKKVKSHTKRTGPTHSSSEDPEAAAVASDLVLGMKVNADIHTFLHIPPTATTSINSTQWVAGRVVSIVKPPNASRANTNNRTIRVKVRFPNGGEIETFWPGNPLLQVPEAPLTASLLENTHGVEQTSHTTAPEESADSIFARLLRGEDSDSDADLEQDDLLISHHGGDNEALRILLGGDDDSIGASYVESRPKGASSSAKQPLTSLVNDAQLQSVHSLHSAADPFDTLGTHAAASALGAPAGSARMSKEVALLATGERVDAFSLEEIERKFEHYRPKFKITPDQGDAGLEIQAAARRDRSFASRQWTGVPSTSSSHSASAYGDDETGLEAQLLEVALNPADDPAVPLPEPEAVFIGKVAKQLRRGETQWRTQLFDVAVRDLRPTSTTSADTSAVEVGCGLDMILPRCTITLNPTALFPLDGVFVSGNEVEGGVDGIESVIQDPVSKENLVLLLALTQSE